MCEFATIFSIGLLSKFLYLDLFIEHRPDWLPYVLDIPSFLVQPGQEIRVRAKSREQAAILTSMDQASRGAPLSWIAVDRGSFSGRMLERPSRTDIPIAAQEQLIVELYSK